MTPLAGRSDSRRRMGRANGVLRGEPAASVLGRGFGVEGVPTRGLGRNPQDSGVDTVVRPT